jgi:hypothetical protein
MELASQWMYDGGHLADLMLLTALFAIWDRHAGRLTRRSCAPARTGRCRPASVRPEQFPLGLLGKEGPEDRAARMPSEDATLERNGRPVAGRHSGGQALP